MKLERKCCIGPFGESTQGSPISEDVILVVLLDLERAIAADLLSQAGVQDYFAVILALLQRPKAALHAALRSYLAPDGRYDGLMQGPATSDVIWLRVKLLIAAKDLLDDSKIDRAQLTEIATSEHRTFARDEWAAAFGVSLTPLRSAWPVESVSEQAALKARVRNADGRLDCLSLVELLVLLKPSRVLGWQTPFAFFVQSSSHHAMAWTTEGVRALAAYLRGRSDELADAATTEAYDSSEESDGRGAGRGGGAERGMSRASDTARPIVEVGAGTGRLAALLNWSGLLPVRVIATDPVLLGSQYPVERLTAARAIAKLRPRIVLCAWMTTGEDWTPEWRQEPGAVDEYVLIASRLSGNLEGSTNVYPLDKDHGRYERHVLEEVSTHLLGIADALPRSGGPFGEGGSVCAIAYRRPTQG